MVKVKVNNDVGIYSPWVVYYNKIKALFEKDPDVKTDFDQDNMVITLWVNDGDKADALAKIMPMTKTISDNTKINIRVIPENDNNDDYLARWFETAFQGNGAFSHVSHAPQVFSNPISFCVFKKEVVQYPNDNIFDEHGVCSTLYQDIAKDVFENVDGVFFCTDTE